MQTTMQTGWNFDNSYAALPAVLCAAAPDPGPGPELVMLNEPLARELGLDPGARGARASRCWPATRCRRARRRWPGVCRAPVRLFHDARRRPRAAARRAVVDPDGARVDIQLKGSGRDAVLPRRRRPGGARTDAARVYHQRGDARARHPDDPQSRGRGDRRAGDPRDVLPGAVLTRWPPATCGSARFSLRRRGTGGAARLADYAIERHFPESEASSRTWPARGGDRRQAALIAKWMLVGFIHGVMNTDNMTISGETIDYGPCAFMDAYDPDTVSARSTSAAVRYGNQPASPAGTWRGCRALLPLIDSEQSKAIELAEAAVSRFAELYQWEWLTGMRQKLGLVDASGGASLDGGSAPPEDARLVEELLRLMQRHRADYTNTFRALTLGQLDAGDMWHAPEFLSVAQALARADRETAGGRIGSACAHAAGKPGGDSAQPSRRGGVSGRGRRRFDRHGAAAGGAGGSVCVFGRAGGVCGAAGGVGRAVRHVLRDVTARR